MLMPSTMQALRTRIYSSTLYILLTSLRVGFDPMEGDRRYSFQPPQSGNRAAYMAHFMSAVYTRRQRIEHSPADHPLPIQRGVNASKPSTSACIASSRHIPHNRIQPLLAYLHLTLH